MEARDSHDNHLPGSDSGCDLGNPNIPTLSLNGVEYVPRLKWTRDRPTVPGDHHLRGVEWADITIIVRVEHLVGKLVTSFGNRFLGRVDMHDGAQWAGPIPPPAEPDEVF